MVRSMNEMVKNRKTTEMDAPNDASEANAAHIVDDLNSTVFGACMNS